MTKEEYNKNRPKIKCSICGKEISKANYNRHYTACNNPDSKLNTKKEKYTTANTTLNCLFCSKPLKNRNALAQHELRCKNNPNRKNYDSFSIYIRTRRKGKNKSNCSDIAKQVKTIQEKYSSGEYTNPLKGTKRQIEYLYEAHNNSEINKWINFINSLSVTVPEYEAYSYGKGENTYNIIRKKHVKHKHKNKVKPLFEHDFIASLYLSLEANNTVHHIDGNPKNNNITNLIVFKTNGEHKGFHNSKYAWLIYDEATHKFNCILNKDTLASQ